MAVSFIGGGNWSYNPDTDKLFSPIGVNKEGSSIHDNFDRIFFSKITKKQTYFTYFKSNTWNDPSIKWYLSQVYFIFYLHL